MHKVIRYVIVLTLTGTPCLNIGAPQTAGCLTIKHYTRRSDSRHKPRQLVGDYIFTHRPDWEHCYGLLSVMPAYSTTFRSEKILNCLFGGCMSEDNCCYGRAIKVQGSAIEDRDKRAWLADYFYLPRNYNGTFGLKPIIKTVTLNFDFYLGLDGWLNGLYLRLYGPFAHSRWDLNFCDKNNSTEAPIAHSCGYFSPWEYEADKLVDTFKDYMSGAVPVESDNSSNQVTFKPLKYARMSCKTHSASGLADLRMELGYNIFNCDTYRLAFNIQAAAPTGKNKKPCYLFDAMIGNGNHWELGGGLNGHWCLWQNDEEDRSFNLIIDANITTMFKNQQCRTFDICGKSNSCYMLAAKFEENAEGTVDDPRYKFGQVGWSETNSVDADLSTSLNTALPNPNKHFALEYTPVANLSTLKVDVRSNVHADVVAMFNYNCQDFSWDLGYNFWARSCEKICASAKCNPGTLYDSNQAETWALKGDARMFGFQILGDTAATDGKDIPLSATQSCATIYSGTNQVARADLVEIGGPTAATGKDINLNVDNAQYAYVVTPEDNNDFVGPLSAFCDDARFTNLAANAYADLVAATDQIKTSSEPIFLSCRSVDLTRTRGTSHALFSNVCWRCNEREDWHPYIGFGASVEFGNGACDTCYDNSTCGTSATSNCCSSNNCCPCCIDCAVAQWTVWLKGGLAFS